MFRLVPILMLALALTSVGCSSTSGSRDTAVRPYPWDTCVVMGSRLGSMGDPITKVYGDQEVKFCCAPCVDEFEEDPEYYLEQLQSPSSS